MFTETTLQKQYIKVYGNSSRKKQETQMNQIRNYIIMLNIE